MKTEQDNIDDWLRREAHVVAGHAFQMHHRSCVPVWPEEVAEKVPEAPHGFLVTDGHEVTYTYAYTPEGEEIMGAWEKHHLVEIMEETSLLPSECWYG